MSFIDKLSQRDELILRPVLNGEKADYIFPFDLNERGSFVDGRLVITKTRLFLLCEGEIIEQRRIEDGSEYKMFENGNAGQLEYVDAMTGAQTILVRFTLGGLKRYSYAENILNAYSEGKDITIYDKESLYTDCPTCGTMFIHNTRTCPKCNNKLGLFKRILLSTKATWSMFGLIMVAIILTSVMTLLNPFILRHLIDDVIQPMATYTEDRQLEAAVDELFNEHGEIDLSGLTGDERTAAIEDLVAFSAREAGADVGMFYAVSNYVYYLQTTGEVSAEQVAEAVELSEMRFAPRRPRLRPIIYAVLLIAAASIGRVIFNVTRMLLSTIAGGRISRNFRGMVYEKINALSIKFLDTKQTGDLMNRVNSDTERIRSFLVHTCSPFISELFIMSAALIAIFVYDWQLGLIVLAPMPLVIIFLSRINFRRRFHAQWVKMDRMNSTLNNILSGIRVVKAFGQEKREIENFCKDAGTVRDVTTANEKFFFTIFPIINFAVGFGNFFVLLYCGTRILGGDMTIGQLVQFSAYAQMLYGRIGWFTHMPREISNATNAANRIYEVIDEDVDIKDSEAIEREIGGAVMVKDLSFGYLSYKPVLKHLNLDIKQGEMIGIVGHSGAGKSTFINLLMRLYDADEGGVYIDGDDLRDLSVKAYKNQIGVVLQEPFLFSGTVYDNIKYSKPEATFEEIVKAAKIANAHDFITQLPNGYDTKVGEKGHSLSGGERQRVSIARAVLNDPKILILDEATASVDTETEAAIQEAFSRLINGRTTFAIAHRLSTLKNADRIMVIDKGELKEFGSHKELMEIPEGIYHGLVMAQRKMSKVKAYTV